MKLWLLEVAKELRKVLCTTALQNGKRLASVLSLILCFHFLITKYAKMDTICLDDIAIIVSMLRIFPDVQQRKCPDYDYVDKMMQPQERKSIADLILKFCNQLQQKTFFGKIAWLYAIPLLHFLQGVSQPFGNPVLDTHEMECSYANLRLHKLRQQTHTGDHR